MVTFHTNCDPNLLVSVFRLDLLLLLHPFLSAAAKYFCTCSFLFSFLHLIFIVFLRFLISVAEPLSTTTYEKRRSAHCFYTADTSRFCKTLATASLYHQKANQENWYRKSKNDSTKNRPSFVHFFKIPIECRLAVVNVSWAPFKINHTTVVT